MLYTGSSVLIGVCDCVYYATLYGVYKRRPLCYFVLIVCLFNSN